VTVVRWGLTTNRRLIRGRFGSGAYAVGQLVADAVAGVVGATAGEVVMVEVVAGRVTGPVTEAWVGPVGDE